MLRKIASKDTIIVSNPVREHILERLDLEPQDEPGPGEFVCLDTFYVGQLKGVGKVWQIIACDAFGSYGVAGLLPAFTAAAVATFLRTVLVPHDRRAGWPVQRVLIDGGPEFTDAFDDACRALGVRHTRTKPRHAWTNGFVERPQGTILQEHWCVAFRRRYFTSRAALRRSLDGLLPFYNYDRPHQDYRLRGQAPRRSSGARCAHDLICRSGPLTVSTPLQVWTL